VQSDYFPMIKIQFHDNLYNQKMNTKFLMEHIETPKWIDIQKNWELFQEIPSEDLYEKIMDGKKGYSVIRGNNLIALEFFEKYENDLEVIEFLRKREEGFCEEKVKRILYYS